MKEQEDYVFLEHILESIEAIENFSKNLTLEILHRNRLKRSAIVRELEIVGEASKNISQKLKENHKEIPWKKIIGTRDLIVDLEIVFDIVKKELPKLKKQIEKIKKNLNNRES